jgi:hypothetical protein
MTTTTASPYHQLPQVGQFAVLPSAQQPAAAQPQAQASTNATSTAGRRSFKSFVDAMDDFGFDRRDVAGMRQVLSMQADNQRAQAAGATPAVNNVASFAPQAAQPDIPVVRGWTEQSEAAPAASNAPELPRMPTFASGPSDSLPHLPANGSAIAPKAAAIPAAELPRLQPSSGRTVGVINFKTQPAANAAASNPQTSSLPSPLQSPMVDQVREATRAGQRPGVSEEMRARFAANAERRRGPVAPMPPKLMAQEARWNRDAWPAAVNQPRTQAPAAPTSAMAMPTLPTATAQPVSNDLPRLPTAN